jgi:hypothetical protein
MSATEATFWTMIDSVTETGPRNRARYRIVYLPTRRGRMFGRLHSRRLPFASGPLEITQLVALDNL